MTLGEQIKQRRETLHMTQEELAERLGVSRQAVSKWEGGQALPQESNRAALEELLGLELTARDCGQGAQRPGWGLLLSGWAAAAVLLAALAAVLLRPGTPAPAGDEMDRAPVSQISEPALTRVRFYDGDQREVEPEALWYDAPRIDSVLLDFSGGTPQTVQIFATPAGSETVEQTRLLFTRAVLDGEASVLLPGDALQDLTMDHVYFQADFGGGKVVASDIYNVADLQQ